MQLDSCEPLDLGLDGHSMGGRSEEEIIHDLTVEPKKRLTIVLQACAVYLATFLFFFVSAKVLSWLWETGRRLKDRCLGKSKAE